MTTSGRELLSQSRSSELNFRLAHEGVQVSNKVAKQEIGHVESLSTEIDNAFRDLWDQKFDSASGSFSAMAIEIKAKPELGGFIDQVAPEAVSMMMAAYGKEWWKGVDSEDLLFVQDIAESNNRRDKLADHIMEQLTSLKILQRSQDMKISLDFFHTVLGYDDARSDTRLTSAILPNYEI
jgi:hypothetical protein